MLRDTRRWIKLRTNCNDITIRQIACSTSVQHNYLLDSHSESPVNSKLIYFAGINCKYIYLSVYNKIILPTSDYFLKNNIDRKTYSGY